MVRHQRLIQQYTVMFGCVHHARQLAAAVGVGRGHYIARGTSLLPSVMGLKLRSKQ